MAIMPEDLRAEVLKHLGSAGFTPPPAIVAAMDQLVSEAVEKNETIEESVERGIMNFLVRLQEDHLSAPDMALIAGCMTGTVLYRLAEQVRRNTPREEGEK